MVRQNISGSVGEKGKDALLAGASLRSDALRLFLARVSSPSVDPSKICRYCGWSPSQHADFELIINSICVSCHLSIEASEGFPNVALC